MVQSHRLLGRLPLRLIFALLAVLGAPSFGAAPPLVTLDYKIAGSSLEVSPAVLSVPKNVAGSIAANLVGATAPAGSYVEATLRGPSFAARRLVGEAGKPLQLPPLNLVGDYSLDGIRLVGADGGTVLEGLPSSVAVHVFDEVLISRVTSRPLSLGEIQEKGIVIDETNFRAVEFEVGFVLDGKKIPVKFPVIAPNFQQSTEIVPAAELAARLAQADALNNEIAAGVVLPPELEAASVNVQVKGINFQAVDPGDSDIALKVPPIPALMVVPGNIGFLHQFFSVLIFTENGAPVGSGLNVSSVNAQIVLPTGADRVAGTYDAPGDDPLRMARVGSSAVVQTVQPVVQPGPDGKLGTPDDIARLQPGETGQAEFLVEGLQEGLHVMEMKLTAKLEGLAAGTLTIEGHASGSVLVRNPKFSMAFAHPRTIRVGEPYDAFVTVLNTSQVVANLVNVTLRSASISGGVLESPETVELGNILPGQTATAKFRVRAQRTGSITFSNLSTSDDSLVGRFRLSMGVDESGVALSPDTLVLPDFANDLPDSILTAANRVLGQALSIVSAAQLPPGVLKVSRSALTQHVLELAEAGQRLRYGDTLPRVLADLLLDWQGARTFSPGFDQIVRATDAGREWREAVQRAIENADALDAAARLALSGPDLAGRGERWAFGAATTSDLLVSMQAGDGSVTLDTSATAKAAAYRGGRGHLAVAERLDGLVFQWLAQAAIPSGEVRVLLTDENGQASAIRWNVTNIPAGAVLRYVVGSAAPELQLDREADGVIDQTLTGTLTPVLEAAPNLISVTQDPSVKAGRPPKPVSLPDIGNYGTVLAVLFSKPMDQAGANRPGTYLLDNGNAANSVSIQSGGRVALLNMRQPLGAIVPRTMTLAGVTDPRGNPIANGVRPVLTNFNQGVAVNGKVVRADGTLAVGVPVTLTIYDEQYTADGAVPFIVRVSQVLTDSAGSFAFDFALAGLPYSVSATDTAGLSAEAIQVIMDSGAGDALSRQKLLELANQPGIRNTLLAAFAVGGLTEAVIAAEGLDRALLKDFVDVDSPRMGTAVPVALRFRGRGTVAGQVFAANGSTPIAGAAVNLFPDPATREQGRGVLTDSSGSFRFSGVPLGAFSVETTARTGESRTLADTLDLPGQVKSLAITLSAGVLDRSDLQGRVTENDNVTPHGQAAVYVGRYGDNGFGSIVASVSAGPDGFWNASQIPVGSYDIIAISTDGKRQGERRNVAVGSGSTSVVNISLQGRAAVHGRVETSTGIPVAGALVGGGEALVTSDAGGNFTLTGVPTGPRGISAALPRNPAAGIDFPRLGSASVNVLPGADNFVVVRLASGGRIVGRVLDAAGNPVPNVSVALPEQGGFRYVTADANGVYEFIGLELKNYTLSAPAPSTGPGDTNAQLLALAKKDASQNDMLNAIGEAFATFTGVNDPLLNGDGSHFNPLTWGFTKTAISFDNQTVVADIHYLREGTVSGKVLNGQGVPIGARVRLTGVGPLLNGDVGFIIRGERDSDPALGTFEFPGDALAGDYGLQAASPFFPQVISLSGRTSSVSPDATDQILQFPAARESLGRLTGLVRNPDGTPVGADVNVKISFGNDYVIHTDAAGRFDTQIGLPAISVDPQTKVESIGVGYTVEAEDLASGLRGRAVVTVRPGQTNDVEVTLLGRGDLDVLVLLAGGTPAAGAAVEVSGGPFSGPTLQGISGADGHVSFANLFEGGYSVAATKTSGPTTIMGRAGVGVPRDQTATTTVRLTPTATIAGVFLARDLATPIPFAQVSVGSLGFATTDVSGRFSVSGVPLGTYRLLSSDPVSGRLASTTVTLATDGEVRNVQLIEQALGEVTGTVFNSYGTGVVASARVTLAVDENLIPSRSVTTGPDGRFSFPGTPAGGITLQANDPVTGLSGSAAATLPNTAASFNVNIGLQPLGIITVRVLQPDGTTPAAGVAVQVTGSNLSRTEDTDAAGVARFADLPLRNYTVRADSREANLTRRAAQLTRTFTSAGEQPDAVLTLGAVGTVEGHVRQSDGTTAAAGTTVRLIIESPLFIGVTETRFSDAAGQYSFANIPAGSFRLVAESAALGASANSTMNTAGTTVTLNLTLGASGKVRGRLVRANGSTPLSAADVLLTFVPQTSLAGQSALKTAADGSFEFSQIPAGTFNFSATMPELAGLARVTGSITTNGQIVDLGDVRLDEEDPHVVSVTPANTTTGIDIGTLVELLFNEPLDAASVKPGGIYLRSSTATVPTTLQLLANPGDGQLRLVRLTPVVPLDSEKRYEVVVVDGVLRDAVGGVIAEGPLDRVGRQLAAPFIASFTTRDQRPPVLLSFTPANNAEQVDTRAVVRLSFDEPLTPGAVITLSGPGGAVAGTTSLGVNNLVLVFNPATDLPPNATFTASVSGLADAAGNLVPGQPLITTFKTLDTIGPTIATLRVKNNQTPIGGATVTLEAVLAAAEPSASVRFTADFQPLAVLSAGVLEMPFTLPANGTVIIRAIAIDRFGNQGPFVELPITVQPNQPPVITFTRLNSTLSTVPSGGALAVRVEVADDGAVTELRAVMASAAVAPLQTSSGAAIILQGVVPANAVPGTKVEVLAQAKDNSGTSSGEQKFQVEVTDGTAPSVAVAAPAANARLTAGAPLQVAVDWADNSGAVTLQVALSGPVTASQSRLVAASPNTTARETFTFDVSAAPQFGPAFTVTVRATDAAGFFTERSRSLLLPDLRPPQLAGIAPADLALRQSLWSPPWTLAFDEPMDVTRFTAANLAVTRNGAAVAATITHGSPATSVNIAPAFPLQPGSEYALTAAAALRDEAGNPWQDVGGGPVPLAGRVFRFTTAAMTSVIPAAAAPIVPGQRIAVALAFEPGLGATSFRFNFNAGTDTTTTVSADATTATATLKLPTNATEARLHIIAAKTGSPDFNFDEIVLNVRPRDADDDGDGISNGAEADAGTDPFRNDANEDPDHDGLTNAQEIAMGTNPFDADTDHDGLTDGQEFALGTNPLLADTDGDGIPDGAEVNIFHTNPLLADTDGDGLSDGYEIGIGRYSVVAGSFTWAEAKADALARGGHLATITSQAEADALAFVLGSAANQNLWLGLTDQFVKGAFRWVTGEAFGFQHFGVGEPNQATAGNHFVYRRADSFWNAGGAANEHFGYILETGFYTDPLLADTDGDGIADNIDTLPGPANRAPVASADSATTVSGKALTIAIATLLANDSDPDAEPFALSTFTQPGHGTVALSGANLIYTPSVGVTGSDSFTYTIMDPSGATGSATVTIALTSAAPVAQNDGPFQTTQPSAVTTGNVLTNDSQPLGLPFSLLDFTQPANGTVVSNGNGTFTYTPLLTFSGTDTFTYRITDGTLASAPATVTITVNPGPVVVWNSAVSGNWGTATNWTPSRVPTPSDTAVINLPGIYTVTLDTDATLATVVLGAASGTQTLNVNGKLLTANALTGSGGGKLLMNAGTTTLAATSTVPLFDLGGGTLTGAGDLAVTQTFNWAGGRIAQNGPKLITPAGSVSNLTSTVLKYVDRIWENAGTVNYTGTNVQFNFVAGATGRIDNLASGIFIINGAGGFNITNSGSNPFNNAGTLIKRGTGVSTTFRSVVNTGLMTIEAGTFTLRGGFSQTASAAVTQIAGGTLATSGGTLTFGAGRLELLSGAISFNTTIANGATLKAGPTQFPITGTLTLNSGARLELALGNAAGSAHSALSVSGATTLNGTLAVSLASGFAESQGVTFPAFTFASRSGDFTAVEGLSQFGYAFTRAFTATAQNLVVQTAGAVPALSPSLAFTQFVQAAFGPGATGTGPVCGPDKDPDHDGVCNLMEFAMGTDPNDSSSVATPEMDWLTENGETYLTITFHRSKTAAGVSLAVEYSSDLVTWHANTPNEPVTRTVSITPAPDHPDTEIVVEAAVLPISQVRNAFLRVTAKTQ